MMKAFQIIFDSLKGKVHEDRGFMLQSKRILMKAFDNFDGYNCGIVSKNDFSNALAIAGVGSGSINNIMLQAIKKRYAKTAQIATMKSSNNMNGIDYKLFVKHYMQHAQDKLNKILKTYEEDTALNTSRYSRRRKKPTPPIGPL
eukprot:g1168.t1